MTTASKGFLDRVLDTLGFMWKRTHIFSFGKPQTDGVGSLWCQDLSPIGPREIKSGELVELHSIFAARHRVSASSGIRFDILEEDFFLTGGLDDLVASLVSSNAPPPEDGYEVLPRTTVFHQLTAAETFAGYVQQFKDDHPHYDSFILVVAEPPASAAATHALTWWRAHYVEDFGNCELYFVVHVDDTVEDGTEQILDVAARPGSYLEVTGRVVDPANAGVQGTVLVARDAGGTVLGSARSDAIGDYRLDLAFAASLTVAATNGFVTASVALTPTDAHRLAPLVAPDIQVSGLSLEGTVVLPSWREPRPATAAADRGTMADVANHFSYTAPADARPGPPPVAAVAEAISQASYDYDRAYAGLPLGGMDIAIIQDTDPLLQADDWAGFQLALEAADAQLRIAVASVPVGIEARGTLLFSNSLVAGNYLIGPRLGYRMVTDVSARRAGLPQPVESNRVGVAPASIASFRRIAVAADGTVTLGGATWNAHVFLLPVVEAVGAATTRVLDILERNLRLADRAALTGLVDSGRLVDTSRLAAMLNAEEQEAVLKHVALRQGDGRTTLLWDHALTGYLDEAATDRTLLPWIPLTDELLVDAHARRREEMTSADYGRYPLKFIADPPDLGRLRARDASRELGDDVREVAIRLLLWGSAAEWVDPNRPAFDARMERVVVRFKATCNGKGTPADGTPARLSCAGAAADKARALYPDSIMTTTFTGVCDLATFQALNRFIGDIPHAEFAFTAYRSQPPYDAEVQEYGRKGFDRMLVYALEVMGQRLPTQRLAVEVGVRPWKRHTLDADLRDLSVNHPEGYGVKVRPAARAANGEARVKAIEELRLAAAGFGGLNAKAGRPGEPRNLLPPMPIGLNAALQEGRLVVAPKSWLEQGDGAGELGQDHGAPVGLPRSVSWRIEEMGLNIQPDLRHDHRWEPPYNPAPAPAAGGPPNPPAPVRDDELSGFTSMNRRTMAAAWLAYRDAVAQWARWYHVPAELVLAMMGTESNFNGFAYRVEPATDAQCDARWHHFCPAVAVPAPHAPQPAVVMATVCAGYDAWGQAYKDLTRHNTVAANPAGVARVASIETNVESDAPGRVSPGMLQTLVDTARRALDADLRPNTAAIVGTRWLLETYDPAANSNAIRAGTSYMRQQADSAHAAENTHFDPPLVSGAYNHGSLAASPNPHNRWRLFQDPDQTAPAGNQEWWNRAGSHTNHLTAWFNDAVRELRDSTNRPDDTFHAYDEMHLDTFMLHHSKWELEWVVGERTGAAPALPAHPRRTAPAQRLTTLARAYTRTNPPPYPPVAAPAAPPARPTPADQTTALHALTAFVAENLDSYLADPADADSRVWARLLWTFASDEVTAKGVGWNHNLRITGRARDVDTGAPLAGVQIEVVGVASVVTSPSGHYVASARLAPLPRSVSVRVRSGRFVSRPRAVDTGYPGEALTLDLTTRPISVADPAVPWTGALLGRTVLHIDGTGFVAGSTSVAFGASAGTAVNATPTTITVTTPAGLPGVVDVTVTTPEGDCLLPRAFTYV